MEVSPYGQFGSIDVVLFQADGHIEFRYYQFPVISTPVTIGIAGSANDYVQVLSAATPTFLQIGALTGALISFYPKNYVVVPYVPVSVTTTNSTAVNAAYVPSYNISVNYGVLGSQPALTSYSTIFYDQVNALAVAPLGFIFTFYNVSYNTAIVSSNGNIQFATSSTLTTSTFGNAAAASPLIAFAWFYTEPNPSYYYATSGTAPNKQFVLHIPNGGAYMEVSPYGAFGSIDVVLFQADGHIELRYYQFPITTAVLSVGVAGSATDYTALYNGGSPTLLQALALQGTVVSFYPVNPYVVKPFTAPSIPFYNSTVSSYVGAIIQNNLTAAQPGFSAATSVTTLFDYNLGSTVSAPIGFAF